MLYKAPRTTVIIPQGSFTVYANFPGHNIPEHGDHGYGPLSAIAESLLEPDTWIPLHEHANEEIISWVPHGVMRHNDRTVGELVTDPDHLMVMNAGKSFWHEERTLADDPHLRMLQIFVRPHTLDLEPGIQHGRLTPPIANEWRHHFGPLLRREDRIAGADLPTQNTALPLLGWNLSACPGSSDPVTGPVRHARSVDSRLRGNDDDPLRRANRIQTVLVPTFADQW